MRNLDRGYRRIALVLGLVLGSLWVGINILYYPDSSGRLYTELEPHNWAWYLAPVIESGLIGLGLAACLWAIMWVATGPGIWLKRGFEEGEK